MHILKRIIIVIIPILILITLIPYNVLGATSIELPARVDHTYEWADGMYSMEAEKNTYVTIKGVKNTKDSYNEDSYENVAIEPSVGYAFYAAKSIGLNNSDMQSIISTSDSWGNITNVKVRNSASKEDGVGLLYQRAKQYGTVYYGIFEDSIINNKKLFRIKDEDKVKSNIKVLVDQDKGTYTVGPYKIELNVKSNEYTNKGAKILYNELIGFGNEGYTVQNAFAKTNIIGGMNAKEGENPVFVDENGKTIVFPNFIPGQEKEFYIRFIPANDGAIIETGNPIINTSYLTSFIANKFIKGTPTTVKFSERSILKDKIEYKDKKNNGNEIVVTTLQKRNYLVPATLQLDEETIQNIQQSLGTSSKIETSIMRNIGISYEDDSVAMQKIIEATKNHDMATFEKLVDEMMAKSGSNYRKIFQELKNIDSSFESSIQDYLEMLLISDNDMLFNVVEGCLLEYSDEFSELLTTNEHVKELFVQVLEEQPFSIDAILPSIKDSQIFKDMILNNDDLVIARYANNPQFFLSLPDEYTELICYYRNIRDTNLVTTKQLYSKFFGKSLAEGEISELAALQQELNINASRGSGVSMKTAMRRLKVALQIMQSSDQFYPNVKLIMSKADLDLYSAISLAANYYDTPMIGDIVSSNALSDETKKKLKYTAREARIKEIKTLKQLESTSMEELQIMDKVLEKVEFSVSGGPDSETSKPVFKDSRAREIRTIDIKGNVEVFDASNMSHEEAVERIYQGKIVFKEDSAVNRAFEAAQNLSSVTLIIENEKCYITIPSNLSAEQTSALNKILDSSTENGIFGVFTWNQENSCAEITVGEVGLESAETARSGINTQREKALRRTQNDSNKLPTSEAKKNTPSTSKFKIDRERLYSLIDEYQHSSPEVQLSKKSEYLSEIRRLIRK